MARPEGWRETIPDVVDRAGWAGRVGGAMRELVVFEDCAHAPIYENVKEFNDRTLAFLQRHSG
jgi:pimeloyl-ACP methyl ester carboxylesterase